MNLAEVKTLQSDKPQVVRPDVALNKKLQQDGLQQAKELQQSFAASLSKNDQPVSDGRAVAARVLANSITNALQVGSSTDVSKQSVVKEKATEPSRSDKSASLFDFEEVAKNVLNFVGGVINKAVSGGESEDKIRSLFEQARSGVEKGISLAQDEIGQNTTSEIEEGISASRDAISSGIDKLENKIFPSSADTSAASINRSEISRQELSEFYVKTRDGDEVKISYGLSQSSSSESFSTQDASGSASVFRQSQNFALSVSGELDEDELKAIGDLVAQADDIANTFYEGDIEKAFQDSLNIGFDNKELAAFAFQLTQAETSQKVQKYGEVQNYSDAPVDLKAPKAVAQYLNKLLDGLDQSREVLENPSDFKSVINSLVNELKDVQVPDLVTAINRFHSFNAGLLEGIEPKPDY
jgi:hypothetical protein